MAHLFSRLAFFLFAILTSFISCFQEKPDTVQGRFTENINAYELLVPHQITKAGDFLTFTLTNFFDHNYSSKRRKRSFDEPAAVHYNLQFNDRDHHLVLWPNHAFMSPETLVEHHYPGSEFSIEARRIKRMSPVLCHYTGKIHGDPNSSAAVSLCDGILSFVQHLFTFKLIDLFFIKQAGYVKTNGKHYFIEPVNGHGPNEHGHHLHVIHKASKGGEQVNANKCGTEYWEAGWQRALRSINKTVASNPFKNLTSHDLKHRFVEVLVVVDKKFIDYHKDKDYENYVMTVMNMVADFYHDASTGNQIDIVVVRIIYLNREIAQFDLEITPDASTTLQSFCKWQNEINPKDTNHPQHHDIAILITRLDMCAKPNTECRLLGMAYVATVCDSQRACTVNEDKGLILGVLLAHEIGHILGCGHDSPDDSGCAAKTNGKLNNVMAPNVQIRAVQGEKKVLKFQNALSYSIRLLNKLGECLLDEPQESNYKGLQMMSGAVYDADYQCKMIFPNSTHCDVDSSTLCETLYCKKSAAACVTNNQPPAPGTKCGHKKWCYHQKCTTFGTRPKSVAGGWSAWGEFSACTRSCGSGVQHAVRECNNPAPQNGGLFCYGGSKQYKLCNTKPCPKNTVGLRAQQCLKYGWKSDKNEKTSTWKPFFPPNSNSCVLYCINEQNVYRKMAPRCEDGTPCKMGTNNVCLAGICRDVGCDWQLNSSANEDQCGECNGNGKECTKRTGVFTAIGKGATFFTKIPSNTKNIVIEELQPSNNMLIVSSVNKKTIYLNGNNLEEIDGEKDFCGSLGYYMHPKTNQEKLLIVGPLNCTLNVYVMFHKPENVGYKYEYVLPNKLTFFQKLFQHKRSLFTSADGHWEFFEWSRCSLRCDGGESFSKPVCVTDDGEVNEKQCSKIVKPDTKTKVCNKMQCKTSWKVTAWGKCSGCKHTAGSQTREVQCVTESPHWEESAIFTDIEKCLALDGPKPSTTQLCVDKCNKSCPESQRFAREAKHALSNHEFKLLFQRIDSILMEPVAFKTKINTSIPEFTPGSEKVDVDVTANQTEVTSESHNSTLVNNTTVQPKTVFPTRFFSAFFNKSPRDELFNSGLFSAKKTKHFSSDIYLLGAPKVFQIRPERKANDEIVFEEVPSNAIVTVPYKNQPVFSNLSDEAFENLGDQISGTLDVTQHCVEGSRMKTKNKN